MAKKGNVPWNKNIKTNKPSYNSLNLDKNELYSLYIIQQLSTTDISKLFDCSAKTIQNWLHKFNIQVRTNSDSVKLNRSKWSTEKELNRSIAYHNTWLNKPQEEKDNAQIKRLSHPNVNSVDSIIKANKTRINNKTSKESKAEINFYHKLLILGFDKNDIIHHYIDDIRYPYNCDFYIKSKDLFIEYQGHYTHGIEPFDKNNEEHLKQVKYYEDTNKDMTTWYKRDVKKLEMAKTNKIKLLLIFPRHNNYLVNNGKITTININDINKI